MYQKLDIENYKVNDAEEVEFYGHEVSTDVADMDVDSPAGKDVRLSLPRSYSGVVLGRSSHQTFCRTHGGVLSQGMCGGPVVGRRGSICGMVEGVVPPEHPDETLRGSAVIIDSVDILDFVGNVERVMTTGERGEGDAHAECVVQLRGGDVAYKTIGEKAVAEEDKTIDPFETIMKKI